MKIILTILSLLFCCNFYSQIIDVENSTNNLSNVTLDINKPLVCNPLGTELGHFDNLNLPKEKEKNKNLTFDSPYARSLRFSLKFNEDCDYNLGNFNQLDWNKVMAIHQTNGSNKLNSIRIGWRWNLITEKMEVGFYGHIQYIGNDNPGREFFYLSSVNLNQFYNVELILGMSGMGIIIDDVGAYIKRRGMLEPNNQGHVKTAFFKSAYFGGQECPPQDVSMRVEGIKGDRNKTNWHTGTCEKTFARSIFYSDENLIVNASRKITLSAQVYRGQYDSGSDNSFNKDIPPGYSSGNEIPWFESDGERYVKIESGSQLVCQAGEEIRLLPGFHAEYGSFFTARINENIVCTAFTKQTDDELEYLEEDTESENNFSAIENEVNLNYVNKAFPNPFSTQLTIEVAENYVGGELSIFDVMGSLITTIKLTKNQLTLDDFNLYASGLYTLVFSKNEYFETQKIVKQ